MTRNVEIPFLLNSLIASLILGYIIGSPVKLRATCFTCLDFSYTGFEADLLPLNPTSRSWCACIDSSTMNSGSSCFQVHSFATGDL